MTSSPVMTRRRVLRLGALLPLLWTTVLLFVPYALLPLLMVAWIRGLREPKGWFWPVVVALVFFGVVWSQECVWSQEWLARLAVFSFRINSSQD